MAILCEEINLLFICVPKTGSSSLEHFLISNFGGKQVLTDHIWDDDGKKILVDYRHINIKEIISHRLLTLAQLEQMKILVVTRNPFDLVVSLYVFIVNCYQRLKQEGEKAPDWITAGEHWITEVASMNFDEYVVHEFNNRDISVYSSFIEGIDEGKVEVVKLEQLDIEVKRIFQELGVELLQNIPHYNKTEGKKTDFRLYYSNKTRQIIEQSFARDFERLGYSFDDIAMFTIIKKIINYPNKFERKIFGYNIESPNLEYSTNVAKVFLSGWVLPREGKEAQIVVEGSGVMETFPCDVQRDDVTKTILGEINPNIKCGFQIKWIHTGIFNISFVIEGEKMLMAEIHIHPEIDSSDLSIDDITMFTIIKKIINFPNKFERKIFGYNIDSPNSEYSTNVAKVFLAGWVLPREEKEAQIVIEGSGVMETFPCDVQRDDVTKTILGEINPNIKCGFQIKWIHTGIFNISFVIEGEKMLMAEIHIHPEIDSSDSSLHKL
ncbi:sulfotransferase family 2 domain-containing protein [Planktothrix agardhii]|uniref:sulfotransferase family 2 domain-containing protein n=1 Tax=Planktothrix agardhii TaxID=1160 RepID=UPI001D0B7D8F|nr:sulfotransferase family 2 domain-containing protein [Planktothrix agardhii]MCB8761123.1 sulfotransferase family protein [Planktothrix agardhii 1813]